MRPQSASDTARRIAQLFGSLAELLASEAQPRRTHPLLPPTQRPLWALQNILATDVRRWLRPRSGRC
jgi:hypothetical protein